jgi:uncharacterized protein (DUF2236 family)
MVSEDEFSRSLDELKQRVGARVEETKQEDRCVFAPGALLWTVTRESCLFAGGMRAVLLQFAHPFVAAGVIEHSNVARDVQVPFFFFFILQD